ncbi:hypothetical protein BDV06DRAFT_231729 [Aspergillus oleicola]
MARFLTIAAGLVSALAPALASLARPPSGQQLQLLPPIPTGSRKIVIDEAFALVQDTDGLTLIPPSSHDFAEVFLADLTDMTGLNWSLETIKSLPDRSHANGAILLGAFTGNTSSITYENGAATSEGYELTITPSSISISGTGARGMFWGTRTLLQMLLLSANHTLPSIHTIDTPAYATRGYMFDAGRKWYPPTFLKEMCSYASFFKMNEFHYHLSDNYPLNRGRNETWQDVYSHFSLLPEDESLRGIIHGRENETLSREEYADIQEHCARRGIAVIPEIEAPGHCLYVTKWRPELSLEKRDLLNLSHPETVPTIQRIWAEFLPWFDVKEVHIGADEYDASLADDYINFVNEMAHFVNEASGKIIRIWGTPMDEPSDPNLVIDPAITVQHWQLGQSDPRQLVDQSHEVINSNDWWAYMGIKNDHTPIYPATYPQFFNESRILSFAEVLGWQWTPSDFNQVNVSQQLPENSPNNKGAVLAAWNDNGPDASTKLEMYYAMRRGIPLVAARAWSGARGPEVQAETIAATIDFFSPRVPAQNLDRVISPGPGSESSTLFSWTRPPTATHANHTTLGKGSKGMNYTLTLTATGAFTLTGTDNTLSLTDEETLIFNEDGYIYPLRSVSPEDALELDPGHPGRIWVNETGSTHEPVALNLNTINTETKSGEVRPVTVKISTDVEHGAVVWVDGLLVGRFEVFVFGGRNLEFSWSQMAFVAPLEEVFGVGVGVYQCKE